MKILKPRSNFLIFYRKVVEPSNFKWRYVNQSRFQKNEKNMKILKSRSVFVKLLLCALESSKLDHVYIKDYVNDENRSYPVLYTR